MSLNSKLKHAKKRAKRKGINYSLNTKWLRKKLNCGICEATGIPFDMSDSTGPWYPSLERMDSSGDYSKENCQVVCRIYNNCKNEFTLEQTLDWARGFMRIYEKKKKAQIS